MTWSFLLGVAFISTENSSARLKTMQEMEVFLTPLLQELLERVISLYGHRIGTAMTVAIKILALFLLTGLSVVPSAFCDESDLGVLGRQYSILERDLLEEIERVLTQKKKEVDQVNKKLQEKSKSYAERPQGIVLPRATKPTLMQLDPAITLQNDIKDADGGVLYAKGTTVNPFDYRKMTKTLCFLDGDDKEQVRWLGKSCRSKLKTKIILLNGEVLKLANKLGRMVYFDQGGYLTQRFGLTALPAKVYQSGRALYVEQIPLD